MKAGKDYIGVGCGAVILNNKNQILLQRRGSNSKNRKGFWTIPGGALEYGEMFTAALLREVQEEIGTSVAIDRFLCYYDDLIPDEQQHWVTLLFLCHIADEVPYIQEPEKCDALEWFSLDLLPSPLTPYTEKAVRLLL